MSYVSKITCREFWKGRKHKSLMKSFLKNYDENSDKGYIFEVDAKYPKQVHNTHNGLSFLAERMKTNKEYT